MRAAALYDIHANLPALDAVLADVDGLSVDLLVIGGDVAWGPMPQETVRRLVALETEKLFVRGNADREVAAGSGEGAPGWVAEVTRWCAEQLSDRQRSFLQEFRETQVVSFPALGDVLFCHASPRSDEESLTPVTPDERLLDVLQVVGQRVVVCGHTHMQFDRRAGRYRIVNAGSVGLPYEGVPGAYWALLDEEITLRKTVYDVDAAERDVLAGGCPHARYFAEGIRRPASREDAAEAFEPKGR